MNALKANKFRVGDKVEIVKLNKTIKHFGGEGVLSPVGTKTFVTYVNITGEEVEIDADIYSYHASDLVLVNGKEESQVYNPLIAQEGVKYDSEKPQYSLLPKGVLNKVINVLGFGSKKYAKDNWMKVDNPKERYYNAAQRHITQWWEGEKFDKETGENHLAHAICCLMFMLWFDNKEDKEVNE